MGKPNFSEAFKRDAVAHSPFLATRCPYGNASAN